MFGSLIAALLGRRIDFGLEAVQSKSDLKDRTAAIQRDSHGSKGERARLYNRIVDGDRNGERRIRILPQSLVTKVIAATGAQSGRCDGSGEEPTEERE